MTRLVMLGVGYGFLVLGVLGLFLPILQGILFIAVGLIILSRYAPWAQRLLDRLKARYPRAETVITRAEHMAEAWVHKVGRMFRTS